MVLGVFLETEEFERKNYECALEKVYTRVSKWKWLLPQLSYMSRVLIVNNLTPSVLLPPGGLIQEIQKAIVNREVIDNCGTGGRTGTSGNCFSGHSFQTTNGSKTAVQLQPVMDRHSLPAEGEGWTTGLGQTSVPASASVH